MEKNKNRVGFIGIIIQQREQTAQILNQILSQFGHLILGRMGMPYREKNINIITLIVDGSTEDIGALTGKIGQIQGIKVRSAFAKE
ncbi:MAG: CopG family transcriptional regulator [Desulfuromonas sp. SDB]|nr:MAG: CopG family transcriptional regulator [Desulfuromonas sp. SDB]